MLDKKHECKSLKEIIELPLSALQGLDHQADAVFEKLKIRSIKQLEKVMLDFDSPRLKEAMDDLGVSLNECQKK